LRELTTLTHYRQCWLTNETAAEGGGRSEGIDTYRCDTFLTFKLRLEASRQNTHVISFLHCLGSWNQLS